ncbi:PREDICTED: activated RNA polymerase II transcriptional coactivator p15 isoform X2 [Polistes dominula]|uniref:Activated RNA polymerase II transcriptional coactivator p15 isoform X2 n=1 Tax=Polistes dominula TaxID=743375 RepID=A0ABM1JGJ8_POLDO|nr:PREDICTED: activated RNA polymerase II transcriptional coactivator p15 isoform X2 [Polistes dominula]
MPKSKEYVSSDSDSDSEEQVKKKQKTETGEKAISNKKSKKETKVEEPKNDGEDGWDLGGRRYVNVRNFKGKLFVDIREMYMDKDGDLKPSKKGICLNMVQWRKFMSIVEEVDKDVKSKC